MKTKRIIMALLFCVMLSLTGCEGLRSNITSMKGDIVGNTFNIDTFDNSYITLVNYCPICGKISFSDPNTELNEDALTIRWRSVFYDKKKEVYEKYKNIPLFESHDAFPSKVDLQQKRNIREEDINL